MYVQNDRDDMILLLCMNPILSSIEESIEII
jgi:hypothetical protein